MTTESTSRNDVLPPRARLTGERSQLAFRLLLDTLARPGTIASGTPVELPPGVPPALLLPLALADVEVSVAVVPDDDGTWAACLGDLTGARPSAPVDAAIVVLLDPVDPATVPTLRRGTHTSPELGAKVAIGCRTLRIPTDGGGLARGTGEGTGSGGEVHLDLTGPGIDGTTRLAVGGLDPAVITAIADANRSFPTGVDTWLFASTGAVTAIPRSTRLRVHGSTDASTEV